VLKSEGGEISLITLIHKSERVGKRDDRQRKNILKVTFRVKKNEQLQR